MAVVPVDKIGEFEDMFLSNLEKRYPDTLTELRKGLLTGDSESKLRSLAGEITGMYRKK